MRRRLAALALAAGAAATFASPATAEYCVGTDRIGTLCADVWTPGVWIYEVDDCVHVVVDCVPVTYYWVTIPDRIPSTVVDTECTGIFNVSATLCGQPPH